MPSSGSTSQEYSQFFLSEKGIFAPSSLKKGNGEIAQKKKKATVQKKIEASESQPPDLKGQGNAERGEGTLDVNALSEDEFNALPEETLRRLRGDFG